MTNTYTSTYKLFHPGLCKGGTFLFKERIMALIRANADYVNQGMTKGDALGLHYVRGSDFINTENKSKCTYTRLINYIKYIVAFSDKGVKAKT